jgi:Cu(I)/Ag(I) efflux system periplasmic protein CusF
MRMVRLALLGLALAVASPLVAASSHQRDGRLIEGEVRKVDKDAKKLTIRHGPIANLEMPAMTMVYQVKGPALLGQVKSGDRIRFAAEKSGAQYTVTRLESAK